MKTVISHLSFVALLAALSLGECISRAITNTAIAVSGTNVILSWPSYGYESYLIQYRQTLDPSDSWSTLTNAYPANSTNRTTFTIGGVVSRIQDSDDGGGDDTNYDNPPPAPAGMSSVMSDSITTSVPSVPMVMPANGSGEAVPLAIYPPGFDLSGLIIFDPVSGEWISGSGYSVSSSASALNATMQTDDVVESSGEAANTGFYRVFHIPDWLVSFSGYTFDGPTFIPVDFAAPDAPTNYVDNTTVLIDGQPTDYAQLMPYDINGTTYWGMGIYFDRFTNGVYQIQLLSTVRQNDELDDNTIYQVFSNAPQTIVVGNEVSFPGWNDLIQGDTYTFDAKTTNPNTDWWIDIYDAWGDYVNTGSGHTSNGQISWTWYLTDYMGNNRDNFDSDPYFYSSVTFNASGGAQISKSAPLSVEGYPDKGEWLIAFQDRWFADAPGYPSDCQQKYEDAMGDILGGPYLFNDSMHWLPLAFGTNVYSQVQRDQSWATLKSWLGDLYARNLYYHGHGGASSIGADRHSLGTNGLVIASALESHSKAYLTSADAKTAIGQNKFRFVFLDGCATAAGDWPNVFAVGKGTNDISYYQNAPHHPRPSVFVGWNQEVGGEKYGTVNDWLFFEGAWMGEWANSSPAQNISQALESARFFSHWIDYSLFWGNMRVYGYRTMMIEDYNHKGDWRWP